MASCDAQVIRDDNGDFFLQVNREAPVINATSKCIDWDPAEARAPIHQAIQHLLISAKPFAPSSRTTDVTILNLNITNDKWCETIDGFTTAGAFASIAADAAHLKATLLGAANRIDTQTLQLTYEDINRADPFNSPEQEGPAELKFLALIPITSLLIEDGPSMLLTCELAGLLGSVTNASRRLEADSDARITAAILLPAIRKYLGFDGPSEVIATQLKPFMMAATLDTVLRSSDADTVALRNDWVDAFRRAESTHTHING